MIFKDGYFKRKNLKLILDKPQLTLAGHLFCEYMNAVTADSFENRVFFVETDKNKLRCFSLG